MNKEETSEVLEALASKRDQLEQHMVRAREMRSKLRLDNIDKYKDFLQKIGELSFVIGSAIVPIIIVSGADKVSNLGFVLTGVGLYLLNGFLSLWLAKSVLERSVDDAPFVGLEEEIHTYPIIHAHNKLLFDLNNKDYQEEYRKTSLELIEWAQVTGDEQRGKKIKVTIWLDALLAVFVVASLLVAKTVWSSSDKLYWTAFALVFLIMTVITAVGYVRARQNQTTLKSKSEELAKIKRDYQDWHNKNILGK